LSRFVIIFWDEEEEKEKPPKNRELFVFADFCAIFEYSGIISTTYIYIYYAIIVVVL